MIPRIASGDEHVPGKEFGALHGRRLASFEVGIHNIPGNLRVQYSSSCVFPPILWWDFGSFIREPDLMRDTIATDIVVTWLNWLCLLVSTKFMKWKPSAFWWEKDSKKPFTALPVRVRIHKPHHPMSQSPSHHPWAPHKAPQDSAAAMPALPKKAPSSSGQANFGKRSNLVEDDNAWRLWGMFAAAVLCAGSVVWNCWCFVCWDQQWQALYYKLLGLWHCPNTADYETHSISTIFDQKSLEMNIPKKCEQPTRQDRMRRLQGKHMATTCPTNKSTFL